MTTAPAEQRGEIEAMRIVDWRYAELVRAGYDADVAAALAQAAVVDLHLRRPRRVLPPLVRNCAALAPVVALPAVVKWRTEPSNEGS